MSWIDSIQGIYFFQEIKKHSGGDIVNDAKYMELALALAKKGMGHVSPNPMVGAVIVKDGAVIGQGWHQQYGGLHAERNALKDCRKDAPSSVGKCHGTED